MKNTDELIVVDTDDFTLEISRGEYVKLKKISKKLKVSINYYLHEFDVFIEEHD